MTRARFHLIETAPTTLVCFPSINANTHSKYKRKRKRISTASYLGGECWTADLGAQSQVNLVVSRRQVEIEVGNPGESIRTQMDVHEDKEGEREEETLLVFLVHQLNIKNE
jgi:hypothetical protein